MSATAIVMNKTVKGFEKRRLALCTRVRVQTSPSWRMSGLFHGQDPFLGREGYIIKAEWDTKKSELLYTVLFGASDTGEKQAYFERSLESLDE